MSKALIKTCFDLSFCWIAVQQVGLSFFSYDHKILLCLTKGLVSLASRTKSRSLLEYLQGQKSSRTYIGRDLLKICQVAERRVASCPLVIACLGKVLLKGSRFP